MSAPRISLEGAHEGPVSFDGEVDVAVDSFGGEPLMSISPVRLEGEITALEGEYLLRATVSFTGELECGRCLATYGFSELQPVHLRLRHREPAKPAARSAEAEEELPPTEPEIDEVFYDEPILPFEEIAREQVLLSLPLKPLCREECLGLCPSCGTDRNLTPCTCTSQKIDPRLEVLKNLK
jgi:uncharacterized protein